MRNLEWSVLLTKYYSGDQIEKNEMGGACSTYVAGERCLQYFGGKTWGKEITFEERRRWEVNIKLDLQELGGGRGLDLFGSE